MNRITSGIWFRNPNAACDLVDELTKALAEY